MTESIHHEMSGRRTALYWRVCGYLSIAWIAVEILVIAAGAYIGCPQQEPFASGVLNAAFRILDPVLLLSLASIATVPGVVGFFRRSRNQAAGRWFKAFSACIVSIVLLIYGLCEFIERFVLLPNRDGSFRSHHFPFDEKLGIGLVIAIPWFLLVVGQLGEIMFLRVGRFRARSPEGIPEINQR